MNNDEKKFEQHVHSIRFDDEPRAAHRDKLEKQLLEAYDTQAEYGDYVEPVSVYFRKLAIAASFLIAASVLFWAINSMFIGPTPPVQQGSGQIAGGHNHNTTGAEEEKCFARIQTAEQIIASVPEPAAIGLATAMKTPDAASAVRRWAEKLLGKPKNKKMLETVEAKIQLMNITDPQNPLVITAESLRQQLGLPKGVKTPVQELPGIQSYDSNEP